MTRKYLKYLIGVPSRIESLYSHIESVAVRIGGCYGATRVISVKASAVPTSPPYLWGTVHCTPYRQKRTLF